MHCIFEEGKDDEGAEYTRNIGRFSEASCTGSSNTTNSSCDSLSSNSTQCAVQGCLFTKASCSDGVSTTKAACVTKVEQSVDAIFHCQAGPWLTFTFWNATFALLACLPTVFVAPESAGSGIPEVMGYLNGVHIRNFLRLKTLAAKLWGTVLIVASGAAVGPEGPLVHTGAILGSGLTRGSKTCGTRRFDSPSLFAMFHNDTDRRDFISMVRTTVLPHATLNILKPPTCIGNSVLLSVSCQLSAYIRTRIRAGGGGGLRGGFWCASRWRALCP